MPTLDELLSGQAPTQPGQPAPPAGEQPSALDAILAAYGGPEPAGPALTPALPSESPQTALNPAQQAAMQRDEETTIRPQSRWESLLGGVPRAFAQRALSGVQAIPGLAARAGSAALTTPEAMRDTAVGRGIERASDVLGDYASRQAETEELRRWQLGQAAQNLGPAVSGGLELVGSAPELVALPAVGIAGAGLGVAGKAAARTVAGAARKAGLKKAPSVPGFSRAKQFMSRWLTSSRGMTPETVAATESRENATAAARIAAKDEAQGLNRMIAEHAAANPGTDKAAIRDGVAALLAGDQPAVKLPGKLDFTAKAMRRQVDHLSQQLIDEGAVDKELADVFQDHLGQYLTRSYRAFDDPKWIDELKASGQWDEIKRELLKMEEFANTPDDAIEGWMESIARRDRDALGTGGGIGTIESGIYKARRSIPKPIRDLLGEYRDPAVQYVKTAERLSRNVETHRMYSALRDVGLREGWLSETPLQGVSRVLAGEGTTRTPVGGMFTTDHMKGIIEGIGRTTRSGWFRRVSAWAKESKTVLSAQAQARNFESNMLLLMGNGNLGTRFMPWGKAGKDLGLIRALKDYDRHAGRRVVKTIEQLDLPAAEAAGLKMGDLRSLYNEARRYGVVGEQVDLNDLRVMLNESDGLPAPGAGKLRRGLRATRKAFRDGYAAGDSIPKLSAWRSEQAKYRWALPDLSTEELKQRAANIVRDTMPTYSKVPQAIERIRQTPAVGPFVSFVSEIPRNIKNTVKIGLADIRAGQAAGNSRLVQLGVHRLASQVSALSFPQFAKAGLRALRPEQPDQRLEWDVAPLLPPWVERGQYALMGVDGETVTVADLSFGDPYAVLKDAAISSIKTGRVDPNLWDRAGSAFKSIADPYISPDVAGGALVGAATGRDVRSGRSIWQPQDTAAMKVYRSALHLWGALEPGTLASALRIGKGVAGVSNQYGRTYDPAIETLALAGPRIYKVNIPEALRWEAYGYSQGKRQAGFNESVADSGNAAQRFMAGRSGEQIRRRSTEHLILSAYAAHRAGIPTARIRRALDDGGMSKTDAQAAMQGLSAYLSGRDTFNAWLDRYVAGQQQTAADRRSKR